MKLEMRSRGMELSRKLKAHIERSARFALTRFGTRLGRVRVVVADVNGPKGGYDIHCKIRADLPRGGELVIQEVHHDPFAAVARATVRAAHTISRRLDRHGARQRGRVRSFIRERRAAPS